MHALQTEEQIQLVRASKKAGAKLFVPSEYSFDINRLTANPAWERKTRVRKEIENLGFQWMYIVTGPFFEYLLGWTAWFIDAKNKKVTQLGDRAAKMTAVSIQEACDLLPQVINDPDNINKTVSLGHTFTTGELTDISVEVLGKEVQISSWSIADINQRIKDAPNELVAFQNMLLFEMASGNTETPEFEDGSKYGKRFSTIREFAPSFLRSIQDGSYSLKY